MSALENALHKEGSKETMENSQNSYILSRGFAANARVPRSSAHPHITAPISFDYMLSECSLWLIELARMLPNARLDGLDISFDQCPPHEWLPQNVSLVKHDIFSEPPSELMEKYDVIHVQLFITILRDGDPVPMLRNLMKMLSMQEPGGWLSWGEWDFTTWEIIRTPSAPKENDELERIREFTSTLGGTKSGPGFISISWIARLHETFKQQGLGSVVVDRHKFSKDIVTLLLDTWMMASQEISMNVLDQLGGEKGDVMRGFIEEVGQNRRNTSFNLDRVITIGRKAWSDGH
ncbi:MAG: hypothetical protein Q9157_003476 [Trypethelium eluteriae]